MKERLREETQEKNVKYLSASSYSYRSVSKLKEETKRREITSIEL